MNLVLKDPYLWFQSKNFHVPFIVPMYSVLIVLYQKQL